MAIPAFLWTVNGNIYIGIFKIGPVFKQILFEAQIIFAAPTVNNIDFAELCTMF